MELLDSQSLTLIKYEPQEILFINKQSRAVYRYLDASSAQSPTQLLTHPTILSGIPFQQGILYPKEHSTLLAQINARTRSSIKQHFLEQQIINTFLPLFKCLHDFHQQGIIHGSIHLNNILIIDEEIKLRDNCCPTVLTTEYYSQKKQFNDDLQALGLCMVNCVLLSNKKPCSTQQESILLQMVDIYSKYFVIVCIIILREYKQFYPQIIELLQENKKTADQRLLQSYQQLKNIKEKKKLQLPGEPEENIRHNQLATLKKYIASNNSKKVVHYENIENKLENQSKKSGEKIGKVIEKGNLSQELMLKKLNEEEKRIKQESQKGLASKTAILNLSNFGVENSRKKIQKERTSPIIKTRNYSKKK